MWYAEKMYSGKKVLLINIRDGVILKENDRPAPINITEKWLHHFVFQWISEHFR